MTTTSRSVYARRAAERDAGIARERMREQEHAEFEAWRHGRRPSGPQGPIQIEATGKLIKLWVLIGWLVLLGGFGLALVMPEGTTGPTMLVGLAAFIVIQTVAKFATWWRHG